MDREQELKRYLAYSADDVRKEFPKKQRDLWLLVGFRGWAKRRFGKQPEVSRTTILNKRIKTLTKPELNALIDRIRQPK